MLLYTRIHTQTVHVSFSQIKPKGLFNDWKIISFIWKWEKKKKYDWVLNDEARKKKRAVVKYFYLLLYMSSEGQPCLSPTV